MLEKRTPCSDDTQSVTVEEQRTSLSSVVLNDATRLNLKGISMVDLKVKIKEEEEEGEDCLYTPAFTRISERLTSPSLSLPTTYTL